MTDITWRTTRLPDALVGIPYEASLGYTGAASAITATAASGGTGLPSSGNLVFNADRVRITGTPKTADIGTYTFKLSVTDTAGAVLTAANVTLVVRPAGPADETSVNALGVKPAADFARQWPLAS